MMDRLMAALRDYAEWVVDYLSGPIVLMQVGIVVASFLAALALAKNVKPFLEQHARKITGMPGL